ncbi:MAG: potassium channel family protein [Anaerolineae bacterium]
MKARTTSRHHWWFKFRRDLRVFVRLFPWNVFAVLIIGLAVMALIFQIVYNRRAGATDSLTYIQAVLSVLKILQLDYDVPAPPHFDYFFVLIPLLGIPFLFLFGVNVLNVIRVFFVRADRGQAWQQTLASTVNDHILICGVGRVGYRLASQLLDFQLPVVGINDVQSPLVENLIDDGMPVLLGDVRSEEVLELGGVRRARTVVVCTDHDLANMETAFHVRRLNPEARVVLRFFEDEIADVIEERFDVEALISRSAVAAVTFAHAAMGIEIIETFRLEERSYYLARVPLEEDSPMVERTVGEVSAAQDSTVILHTRDGKLHLEPPASMVLRPGDELLVFVADERLHDLVHTRTGTPADELRPVIVCGLGHTGYRVVNNLLELKQPVVAADFEPDRLSWRLMERGVPVHFGDFRRPPFLEELGVREASALVACTETDMINLETVLRSRELNPRMRLVLRLFEEGLGEELRSVFGLTAVYSTSAIANPAFLSATLQMHVAQPVEVEGSRLFLTRLEVNALSALVGTTITELDAEEGLTAVLHARGVSIEVPPPPTKRLKVGDEIVVLASQEVLRDLSRRNRTLREVAPRRGMERGSTRC